MTLLLKPYLVPSLAYIFYLIGPYIPFYIKLIGLLIIDKFSCKVIINSKQGYKCTRAIKEEIKLQYSNRIQVFEISDGRNYPRFEIIDGNYWIKSHEKWIYVNISGDNMTLRMINNDIRKLRNSVELLYKTHCSPDQLISYFISQGNKWKYPYFRAPRNIINISSDMQSLLGDVETFLQSETNYSETGRPFRKRYLIEGPSGVGKTLIAEVIANKYKMDIYSLCLNHRLSDDASLVGLISEIPPQSILLIDEFEKQYVTLQSNKKCYISLGGILSALDGAQRISHGTIIIITVNDKSVLPSNFLTVLMRQGRIDKHYLFKTII